MSFKKGDITMTQEFVDEMLDEIALSSGKTIRTTHADLNEVQRTIEDIKRTDTAIEWLSAENGR